MYCGICRYHAIFTHPFLLVVFVFFTFITYDQICYPSEKRTQQTVGIIASATGDAKIRFVDNINWEKALTDQGLVAGDGLRTGPLGALALLFNDRTQIRIHRNSVLTIKAITENQKSGRSVFRLNEGGAWARSARDNTGVSIETPSATAAIRGTDWSLYVNEKGRTTLIVLDGTVMLKNAFGQVQVSRGEIAFAEIGRAPSKTVIVSVNDHEQIYYNMSLAAALCQISLTGMKTGERRIAMQKIEAVDSQNRTASDWLYLAELAYDDNDKDLVRQCLDSVAENTDAVTLARGDLVRGYLAISGRDFDKALLLLKNARKYLDTKRRLTAMIGQTGALLINRKMERAQSIIAQLRIEYASDPLSLAFEIMITAFAGDLTKAEAMAQKYGKQFPDQATFPAMEGGLALVLGHPKIAEKASQKVLTIDPESAAGFFNMGTWQSDFLLDKESSIETFKKGLHFNKNNPNLWGGLANSYYDINEMRLSEAAFLKAISLSPKNLASLCNYAILLLDQYRTAEAAETIDIMTKIDPSRDVVRILQGRLALQTNRLVSARDFYLEATTVNPAMSLASLGLAIAYYQNGELNLAYQALDNAGRIDPYNPEIPLVGAIMANDQAQADDAIEYARATIEKYRKAKGTGFYNLAASRGGKNTLGGAFMGLSLNSWADYYNEISFDPYSADSHFYRALQSSTDFSSLYQGLMLESLAVSDRNRFVDFYRRPFTDTAIGGSVSWPEEGTGYSSTASIQGFEQTRVPVSYSLMFEMSDSPGNVDNADKQSVSGMVLVGMNLTPYDRVFLNMGNLDDDAGLPGTRSTPDGDDDREEQLLRGEVGYSHSFGARNIFMGHLSVYRLQNELHNTDPLGSTLSALDYSLISNFGIENARMLHEAGLTDVTDPDNPNSPLLLVGSFTTPTLTSTIGSVLDIKPLSRAEIEDMVYGLQCRHMFSVDDVDVSYGAELISDTRESTAYLLEFSQRDPGVGLIYGEDQSLSFLFGDPVAVTKPYKQDVLGGNAHMNALWRMNKKLWLEGGLWMTRYDNDLDTSFTKTAPRGGIAWQPDNKDWFRIMARKDIMLPGYSTLAPVTTVGMTNDMSYVAEGGRSTLYQARWDREWFAHLFTTLRLSCQEIHGFTGQVAENSFESYSVNYGRINSLGLSANVWVRGGIGIFAGSVFRDTNDHSKGIEGKPDLPLVPRNEVKAGITWVHPSQIRVSLTAKWTGEQPVNPVTESALDDYLTTDVSVSWQPLHKHLELGISVANLFDESYDQATDMPGPGREISIRAQMRF